MGPEKEDRRLRNLKPLPRPPFTHLDQRKNPSFPGTKRTPPPLPEDRPAPVTTAESRPKEEGMGPTDTENGARQGEEGMANEDLELDRQEEERWSREKRRNLIK